MGKFAVISLLLASVAAGAGVWYTSTQAFWAEDEQAQITAVSLSSGEAEVLSVEGLQAVRAESSPMGFRACFQTPLSPAMLSETYVLHERAPEPTIAPPWFDCFDAGAIAAQLNAGEGLVFVAQKNIGFGVDRLIAVMNDGRGYAWHELNDCGRKAYDGSVIGEACPDRATYEGTF